MRPALDSACTRRSIPGVFAGRPAKQVSDFLLDYARRWTALGRPPLGKRNRFLPRPRAAGGRPTTVKAKARLSIHL